MYVINRGTVLFFPGIFTLSPNQSANFFSVISGVEKVRECVAIYSSVAALPLKISIINYKNVEFLIIANCRTWDKTLQPREWKICSGYNSFLNLDIYLRA